ncbi:hypothetical protein [Lacrimispora xylanisolvens]|uniref:hypothetical protein n=1 Tax=Lacrimispora xylanisolvens TaxID=384636 RepID=UPI00240293FA
MSKRKDGLFLVVFLLINLFIFNLCGETVKAASVVYVSTAGNDYTGTGTLSNPWKTIQKAADTMTAGDTCIIRGGTYRETVTLNTFGTSANPITFKAFTGETVTVSGADPVTGWVNHSGSIYYAAMAGSLGTKIRYLLINKCNLKPDGPIQQHLIP